MIFRAKCVLPMGQAPIEDGAVVVEGDRIVAVGPTAEIRRSHGGDVRDLGEVVICPGLINAHCHLDYSGMIGKVHWRGSFIEWALQLVELKRQSSEKQYLAAIQSGIDQLARTGTTSVVNIESFPLLIDQLAPSKLRIWWCLELYDYKRDEPAAEIAKQALEFVAARQNERGGFGLSPHAPYTTSPELYKLSARFAHERNLPLTTHLAESTEEDDMFRRGTGPMYDYFRREGRDMNDCKRLGAVQLVSETGVLGPNCLAAHMNCLTPLDVQMVKETGCHVVHCPKSHRFFQRGTPMLNSLWHAGVNICLGTDSLASNDTLDMFAEMQTLAREYPDLPSDKILKMATTCPAAALNQSKKLGRLIPGAWADLIAVPLDDSVVDPHEAVVYAEKPVCFSMVGGKVVVDENA